ncbi:MAG: hypothetical protein N2C14_17050 [Planctomycetales bacterium]
MRRSWNPIVHVVLLLLLALTARSAACVWWQSRLTERFGFPDSESYWVLAERIADGRSYQSGPSGDRIHRAPGYPLILAAWFRLWGDHPPVWWARALSVLLGTSAVAGVYALGRLIRDDDQKHRRGMIAGIIAALYPGAIGLGVFPLSEAPFCPLMVLQLALAVVAWKASGNRGGLLAFAAGLVAGAAVLTRPSWLLFTPVAAMVACVARRDWDALRWGGLMTLGLAVAMTPWWVRNARLTGGFVPTTLQVGASLYDGWNPHADGSSNMDFVPEFRRELAREWSESTDEKTLDEQDVQEIAARHGVRFEQELDRGMKQAAMSWALGHPARAAELMVVKFFRMWNPWPNEPRFRSLWLCLATAGSYLPLLALTAVGAIAFRREPGVIPLMLAPAVYFTLLHVVFAASLRYRQPALLPWMAVAALTLSLASARKSSSENSPGQSSDAS